MKKSLSALVTAATLAFSLPALASAMPDFPHMSVRTHTLKMPNPYKLAPVPPFIQIVMRDRTELHITQAQTRELLGTVSGNRQMMLTALSVDKTLHEDLMNGITGKPLKQAEAAVLAEQKVMLMRSIHTDEDIWHILTPAQMRQAVAEYRALENRNLGIQPPPGASRP